MENLINDDLDLNSSNDETESDCHNDAEFDNDELFIEI